MDGELNCFGFDEYKTMTTNKVHKRVISEQSREQMRQSALSRYDRNAEEIYTRVRKMMHTIQAEIDTNEGIYPHNRGSVSLAEVARRAQMHPVTFHKKRYIELAGEVKHWLEKLHQGSVIGPVRIRKELGSRVQQWKQLYESLREAHRLTETDLAHAEARLQDLLKKNLLLQERIAELLRHKILPLKPV